MKQRDVFLESEGDAWFERNARAPRRAALPGSDPLLAEMLSLSCARPRTAGRASSRSDVAMAQRLGMAEGEPRLRLLGRRPSAQAVEAARARGVAVEQGTAEQLPFADDAFDIVLFGFCLYLCDRDDLFRIAYEADRVLKDPGWLLILDFYVRRASKRAYHHRPGLYSHKMDYRTLFSWNPAYVRTSRTRFCITPRAATPMTRTNGSRCPCCGRKLSDSE